MRAEDADRLARLHEEGLVLTQGPQRRDDLMKALPVARGLADSPIDDQVLRPLADLRVEVVEQHAQRSLGQPVAAAQLRAAGRPQGSRRRR